MKPAGYAPGSLRTRADLHLDTRIVPAQLRIVAGIIGAARYALHHGTVLAVAEHQLQRMSSTDHPAPLSSYATRTEHVVLGARVLLGNGEGLLCTHPVQ